jgi:hypothetical protein
MDLGPPWLVAVQFLAKCQKLILPGHLDLAQLPSQHRNDCLCHYELASSVGGILISFSGIFSYLSCFLILGKNHTLFA